MQLLHTKRTHKRLAKQPHLTTRWPTCVQNPLGELAWSMDIYL
jgi:hypothetical protein